MSVNGIVSNHFAYAKHGSGSLSRLSESRIALGLTEKSFRENL